MSHDFLASDFVSDKAKIQAVPPENGKLIPISLWENSDVAFQKVMEGIKRLF